MSLDEARSLIQQRRIYEAFILLQKLRHAPVPTQGAWLTWAELATVTPFSYLAIEGARKEYELFRSDEAKTYLDSLQQNLLAGRERSSKDYPLISLIGIASPGSEELWKRCVDSLCLQFNSRVELLLYSNAGAAVWGTLPSFVTLHTPSVPSYSLATELTAAVQRCNGEFVSIIQNPSTIFSDHGLVIAGASFKTVPNLQVVQTERLCYGVEGVATPIRIELPTWTQATILDPLSLEVPTLFFNWRGTFFRKKTLLECGLPLDASTRHATAYDVITKIVRTHPIHSLRAPVVVDDTPLEARSFVVPLAELAEARVIIERERKLLKGAPSQQGVDIVEISKKTYNFHSFPKIAPFVLIHGEKSAPPITIVTPVFNGKEYLDRCIDSVLSQNYPNLEYMILDGGSTDGSQEIIKRYEKYLSFYRSAPDAGHYAAAQEGLARSRGTIMSWINADDLLAPYSLRLTSSIFTERAEIQWITGKFCLTSDQNDLDISISTPLFAGDSYFEDGFDRPFIQQEGTFWRRSLWDLAGGSLDLRLELAADMELWTRFFQHTKLFTLSVPLGVFRRRKGQRSEAFINRYYHEAYGVIQRLKAEGKKPYMGDLNQSTMLQIPLE